MNLRLGTYAQVPPSREHRFLASHPPRFICLQIFNKCYQEKKKEGQTEALRATKPISQ